MNDHRTDNVSAHAVSYHICLYSRNSLRFFKLTNLLANLLQDYGCVEAKAKGISADIIYIYIFQLVGKLALKQLSQVPDCYSRP
jgi:hypothetical protein